MSVLAVGSLPFFLKYILKNLNENIATKKTKLIQCVDCGEWFETWNMDTHAIRCEYCSKIYRKKYKAKHEKMRRIANRGHIN